MEKNKMGTMPIPKLVISMSLPAIFAMLIQALYNVVDSMFVSNISATNNDGLAAISLAFPLQLIVIAVFVGLGVGINSLVSRRLGEKDYDGAVLVAENGVMVAAFVYIFVAIGGYFLARPFYQLFTENTAVVDYATVYTQIVMVFAFGRILSYCGSSVMQGTGEMVKPMIGMLIGALLNMILDPIFIFGYLGMPAMGVEGAAYATIIAQIVAMLYVWYELIFGKNIIKLNIKKFRIDFNAIKEILKIGIPVSLMQGLGSIMLTGVKFILSQFGDVAISVMGAYFKIQSMVFMPVFGLSTGTLPIIGFNYGARNKERLGKAVRFSASLATGFMILCFLVFQIFSNNLIGLFNPGPEMLAIGLPAFRTISLMFPLVGITVVLSTTFNAFGKAHYSLIISMIRQLVVLLPVMYFLSQIGNIDVIWFAFLAAEVVGFVAVALMFRNVYSSSVGKWSAQPLDA